MWATSRSCLPCAEFVENFNGRKRNSVCKMAQWRCTTMTTEEAAAHVEQSEEQDVIDRVLDKLGRPKNLFRTVAKKLWNNQYRVNIYCTDEAHRPLKTVSMTDSFFVTVSGADIVSQPTISRKYE